MESKLSELAADNLTSPTRSSNNEKMSEIEEMTRSSFDKFINHRYLRVESQRLEFAY